VKGGGVRDVEVTNRFSGKGGKKKEGIGLEDERLRQCEREKGGGVKPGKKKRGKFTFAPPICEKGRKKPGRRGEVKPSGNRVVGEGNAARK